MHLSQAIRRGSEYLGELDGSEVVEKHVALTGLTKSAAKVHGWNEEASAETNRGAINLMVLAMSPKKLVREMEQAREAEAEVEAGQDLTGES